ncbi:far upstream element-binding protein 2-like isoform X4 [Gymnodraco acuticeps]|uniref:Far upstream element-binding protein 2-like isoform X4 n=1 Tax=Gymnodraco acuticeps TaxID=8218 RepID=A0A6P8VE98_GYMAC|nr:far upstream element-binding protein 2-like isoform X4 [Gymnodraco acuticeps]
MSEYNAVPAAGPGDPLGGQTALGNGAGGIQKDAFADAVQRARLVRRREIAAKIGVDAGPPPTNNNTASDGFPFTAQKRQLEDADEPESKKLAAQSDLDSANALSIGAQLAALQSSRPASNTEEYSVPDSMVGLIIGRGGEQINKIQQESGCKVQIAPDSGGLPDRSVSLTGSQDSIQNARRLLDEIVSRGRGTPPSSYHESTNGQSGTVHEMMIPAGKAGLVIGKGGETIKQLQQAQEMVQDILRERDHGGFNERNDFSARMGGGMDIPIPRHSVGVVIGRNGEMIKKIQNDTGVRIQFKQDDGTGPDKIAHISGPPDCCDHASQIINDLLQSIRVRDEGQGVNGPPGPPGMPAGNRGRGGGQGGWGPPGGEITFSIPAHKCGLVIGRGGENVKSINQQTGAFVEICRQPPPNGDPNFKIFIIRGSPQQIDHAKQLIEEKIEIPLCPVGPGPGGPGPGGPMGLYNPDPYNPGPPGAPGPPHGGPHQYPPQGWSNTYQQWQPQAPHDPSMAAANDPNAAWAAYYAQYYHQPPGGGPAQNPATPAGGGAQPSVEQTQPAQTPGGQPDYSKAWEEYYKQMGQAGGSAPAPAAPGGAAGGAASTAGGEPDYSAAWAEYYRLQASYYGQTGQAAGQPAAPQQGQVGTERGFHPASVDPASDTEVCFQSIRSKYIIF